MLEETVDGYPRRVWRNEEGQDVIESFTITSMAHGTPLATGDGENAYGSAGPFLLDVGISSTYHIAQFWGLHRDGRRGRAARARAETAPHERAPRDRRAGEATGPGTALARHRSSPSRAPHEPPPFGPIDMQAVIDRALKAAGLKS